MTWLTNWLASRLSLDERQAVLGDAAERGTLPVRDLLSMLVWREAHAWTTGAPWIALVTLVLPLGLVLSVVSRYWANSLVVMSRYYIDTPPFMALATPNGRTTFLWVLGSVAVEIVCLVLWSWTIGRALRLLSGRAVITSGMLITCVVFTGTIGTTTLSAVAAPPMFASGFARFGAALFVRFAFVLVPIWCGVVSDGRARWGWSKWARTVSSAVAIGITFKWIGAALFLGWVPVRLAQSHPPSVFWWAARFNGWSMLPLLLAPLALAWPAAYLLIHERRRRVAA